MQVISGPVGRSRVHFQAPPATRVEADMVAFLCWFEQPSGTDSILRACIAHLWFVSIHPFDDGNGRIARALADMVLARGEGMERRYYSLSSQIRRDRSTYYATLEHTQKGDLDITERLLWFVGCFTAAIEAAEVTGDLVLHKAEFRHRHRGMALNARQILVLNRFLDGFEGKFTAQTWARIAKCSLPTAQRDIKDLLDRSVLARNPGGSKNSSYRVA